MFSTKCSRLYVFVLFMSSALNVPLGLAQAEGHQDTQKEVKVGRKFQTDYSLMQNLLMQLENERTKRRPLPVETKGGSDLADQQWLQDEVGAKQAARLRQQQQAKPAVDIFTEPAPVENPSQEFKPAPKVINRKLRVRSR